MLSDPQDVGILELPRRSTEGDRDLFLDLSLLWLDSDEAPSLRYYCSNPDRRSYEQSLEKLFCHRRQLGGRFEFQPRTCLFNYRKQSTLDEFPAEPEVVAIVVDCGLGSVATVGRLTAGRRDATGGWLISATSLVATVGRFTTKRVSVATVGRLTAGRRDATGGRLISTTSLVATVGRLTTKFGREDDTDAPPVPSAA